MNKRTIAILTVLLSLFVYTHVHAKGQTWKSHQKPFNFTFSNHIDTHQQTMELPNGELLGYLYVEFTGEYTEDGIPVAKHSDCDEPSAQCSVGWQWRGVPGMATFVYHEAGDHPLWFVGRNQITQPGAYSHFHWLGLPEEASELKEGDYEGYFLELTAKDTFAFEHGKDLVIVNPGIDLATHLNLVTVFPGISID
jgi:hypothetical protein